MDASPIAPNQRPDVAAVRLEHWLPAPPRAVTTAFADPRELQRWFVDHAEGGLRPGDPLLWRWDGFGSGVRQVVQIHEPGSFYSVGPEGGGECSGLCLSVRADRGGSQVSLEQRMAAGTAQSVLQGVHSGWTMALTQLEHYLQRYFGLERRKHLCLRITDWSQDKLERLLCDPEGLAQWVGGLAEIGAIGGKAHLDFGGRAALEGPVLARSGVESLLAWPSLGGVLEVKGFPSTDSNWAVCLRVSSWASSDRRFQEVCSALDEAFERLWMSS